MSSFSRSTPLVWIARHPAWASALGIVAILGIGYLALFRQQIAALRRADRADHLNEERAAKEGYLQRLDALASEYQGIDPDDIARARTMIPNEEDLPGILAMLDDAARTSDVQLTAVNFAAGDPAGLDLPHVGSISISISLQHGNYQRFKLFLEALQGNLRLFDVRSATINPASASYALTLRAYVWKKPS